MNDSLDCIWYSDFWMFWVALSPEVTFPSVLQVPPSFLPFLLSSGFTLLPSSLLSFPPSFPSVRDFFSVPLIRLKGRRRIYCWIVRPVLLEPLCFSTNARFSICDIHNWSPQFFPPLIDTIPLVKRNRRFWLFSSGGLEAQQCRSDRASFCGLWCWSEDMKGGPLLLIFFKKHLCFCLWVN